MIDRIKEIHNELAFDKFQEGFERETFASEEKRDKLYQELEELLVLEYYNELLMRCKNNGTIN